MGALTASLSLLLFLFASTSATPAAAGPQIHVWPKPVHVAWPSPAAAFLSPSFRILSPYPGHRHLRRAVARYARLVLTERHRPLVPRSPQPSPHTPPLRALAVSVTDLSAPLHHGADESYSLSIPPAGAGDVARLAAGTPWGAMRGLETFSQMAWGDPPAVPVGVNISDGPIFPHRGLMLDTSRNYYPVGDILRTIGAMADNKLNVFHWHVTDSHSFPILLPSEPELALKGAYARDMMYSPADVRRIVDFAMSRGVRVVPEFDAPGHSGSWAEAYPGIVTCANEFWLPPGADLADRFASEPGTGQLNPLNPETYRVVRNVLGDAARLFPEPFLHLGADEVAPGCWKADPAVRAFLSRGGTLDQLLEVFVNTTHPYAVALNRTAVYWEDVLLDAVVKVRPRALPRETTILQTWNNGPNNTKRITASGYRVIVSSADFYYLDCGHGGFVGNDSRYDRQVGDDPAVGPFNYAGGNGGSWCAPFKTWQRVYDYDITYGLSEREAALVLGGEVALWSEQADPAVLDSRVWPRASAMAEALWSGNKEGGRKRYAEATDRLNEWRHRMVRRGVGAEPIQPLWCVFRPTMCNLVQ
uniref:Beta-hexosaminidase n=1 Tax=Anthurium amnicola TaxID=1678845 RepID=A0A1D1ZL22_9ARAE